MQAIEFEATADHQHRIRIPDHVPEGTRLRVLLLLDDTTSGSDTGKAWKSLLSAMPDVGRDDDFLRPSGWKRTSKSETDLKNLFFSVTEGLTAADLERLHDCGQRNIELD